MLWLCTCWPVPTNTTPQTSQFRLFSTVSLCQWSSVHRKFSQEQSRISQIQVRMGIQKQRRLSSKISNFKCCEKVWFAIQAVGNGEIAESIPVSCSLFYSLRYAKKKLMAAYCVFNFCAHDARFNKERLFVWLFNHEKLVPCVKNCSYLNKDALHKIRGIISKLQMTWLILRLIWILLFERSAMISKVTDS